MIIFKEIKFKNILSYGNNWTIINLVDDRSILISGKNGTGKSTFMEALTFALYGKAFRKITIYQLINSINQKEMLVELTFSIGDNNYKIVRGKTPGVFEIWINDSMIPQAAATKDYQKILTEQIIKMNYDTFTQIVILGSSSFVPFMNLTPQSRKMIIENLLDISVFSTMNQIIRERMLVFKEELQELKHKIELLNNSYKIKKEHAEENLKSSKELIKSINEKITIYNAIILTNENLLLTLETDIIKIGHHDPSDILAKQTKMNEFRIKIAGNISRLDSEKKFLETNNHCDRCSQSISDDHKEIKISELTTKLKELSLGFNKLKKTLANLNADLIIINDNKNKILELTTKKNTILTKLRSTTGFITSLEKDKIKAKDAKAEINTSNLKELEAEITINNTELQRKNKEGQIYNAGIKVLKDDGVKTKVIKHYLPMINHYTNLFLQKLGFSILFEFNENFNEIIKARYRDKFSYGSFSEGEKTRINLALLFTWRSIAKLKNNASCNLLILDEILDGSLDSDGIADFLDIIGETDNSNIIIISHREETASASFNKNIRVTTLNNFSQLKIMET